MILKIVTGIHIKEKGLLDSEFMISNVDEIDIKHYKGSMFTMGEIWGVYRCFYNPNVCSCAENEKCNNCGKYKESEDKAPDFIVVTTFRRNGVDVKSESIAIECGLFPTYLMTDEGKTIERIN